MFKTPFDSRRNGIPLLPVEQVQLQENNPYSFHHNVLHEHKICGKCKNKELYISLPTNKQKAIKVRNHLVIIKFVFTICISTI